MHSSSAARTTSARPSRMGIPIPSCWMRPRRDDLEVLALGEHDPLGRGLGLVDHHAHHLMPGSQPVGQILGIGPSSIGCRAIPDAIAADATAGATRSGTRGSQRLGNEVVGPELEALPSIRPQHRVGHVFLGQGG